MNTGWNFGTILDTLKKPPWKEKWNISRGCLNCDVEKGPGLSQGGGRGFTNSNDEDSGTAGVGDVPLVP